jgi:hypothetical protein
MATNKKCKNKSGKDYFTREDLIKEIGHRYEEEIKKNPQLKNSIRNLDFKKEKMCLLLGIPTDENKFSIDTGRGTKIMGLDDFIKNNYRLEDPGGKVDCSKLKRDDIIKKLGEKYAQLNGYTFKDYLHVDPTGLNKDFFNIKVLCELEQSNFKINATMEEILTKLRKIKESHNFEIRDQIGENDPAIHSLNCPFIQNYKEIDFLKFEKILLNIFSKCVKKKIDIQNSIISMTYLDEYKNRYEDSATKTMATQPICDIAEGQTTSMYDHIIEELNKLNGKVLHDNRKINKEFNDDILINLTYSTDLFDKEIKKLYDFFSDQTNNFEDAPSIIYYLNFFNLELRSLIKQASNSLGKLLDITPILKEQLYALILKSKRLEVNKSETTQQIRNILKFYNLEYIVDDLVKEITILFIKHVLGDNLLSKILLDPFKAIKAGLTDLRKISKEVKAGLDIFTEKDSRVYINQILSIIGFGTVFDKLLNQMDIIHLRLVLSSMSDTVDKISDSIEIIGNDSEQYYINSLLLINDGLKIISGKSGLRLNNIIPNIELDLDKLIQLLEYMTKLPDDLDSKIQYFKTVANNLKEEKEKEIQKNPNVDKTNLKFHLTAKFLVFLNTNPRDILFKSTNPSADNIDNDKVSRIWDFVENLSSLSEEAVTKLREYLISKRDTIKMTITFFKGYDTFYSTIEKHKKNTFPTIFKLIEPILYYTPFRHVINLYSFFKPKKYKLEEDLFDLIKQFDITKPGKSMDLIISSILYKLEKHSDLDKLIKLKDTALPLLGTLISLFDFEKKTDSLILGYTSNMISICSNETNKDLFESCIKNETFYILTIFVERTFDIIKNFISDNYTKDDKLYSLVPVLDKFTPEQKQKYALSIVEGIYDVLKNLLKWSNKTQTIFSKTETDEFGINGSLLSVKNKLMGLFNIVTELVPDLKKNEVYFTFILDIMFVCLQKIKDSTGIFLLANQFIYAYVNNLSNPKSDIYKAILSHDLIKIVLAFIQITTASFPTLLLKLFQIADTYFKSSSYSDIWTSIVGKKLKYPIMGDGEVKIIANRVLYIPSITIRGKVFFKVQDMVFPASVGQVHDFKTEEQLTLTHTEFEKQFLETLGMMNKESDEFKINKYLYNKSLITSYEKELKEDIDDLKTNFDAINTTLLDNVNVQILKKVNWQNLKDMSKNAKQLFNESATNLQRYKEELTIETELQNKREQQIDDQYVQTDSQTGKEYEEMLQDKYTSDPQLYRIYKNIEKIEKNISREEKIQTTHNSPEAYETYVKEIYFNLLNLLMYYLIGDKSKLYKLDIMKDDNELLAKLFDMKLNSINFENKNAFFDNKFLKKIENLYKYFDVIYTDLSKILDLHNGIVEAGDNKEQEKDNALIDDFNTKMQYFFRDSEQNLSELKELLGFIIPEISIDQIDIIINVLQKIYKKEKYDTIVETKILDKIRKIEPINRPVIKKYIIETIIENSPQQQQNYTPRNQQLLKYFETILKDKKLMDFLKPVLLNYNSYVHNTQTYILDNQDILIFVNSLQNVLCTYDFNRALLNFNVLKDDTVIDRFINKQIQEQPSGPGSVEPQSESQEINSNLRNFYKTHTKKIEKLIKILEDINNNFSILVENGIDNYQYYNVIPNTVGELKEKIKIFNNKLAEYQVKKISVSTKINTINLSNVEFETDNADFINKHKDHMEGIKMDAFVQKSRLQKYIIKFVKIRSRLGLCIEKSVIPDSVSDVVKVYRNKNFDKDIMKKIVDAQEIVTCKIKAVSDEFDLWEELVNTNKGKELYDYPESFLGDYDKTDYYCIRVTDVMMSFDSKDGVKPLYNVDGEFYQFKDFKNQGTYKSIQKGFYTAMIQEKMPGKTLGDLEKENMSKNELNCLQKAVIKFFSIYLSTIMIDGKYHGDPHPGNVMWDYDYLDKINGNNIKIGQLSIIDFGDWIEIEPDVRFSVLSIVLFVLCSFFNPYPDIMSGEFISRNFAKLIVESLQIDHYDAETLKNLYVNNKLYKEEKDIELIDIRLVTDTKYRNNIIAQCKYILSSKFSEKLFSTYKNIVKSYEGGDFLAAILKVQDSELLNSIFKEVNNIHENTSGTINCEKLGIRVTKLLEAISKLHGFTKYISLTLTDMLNVFFMTIETVINKTQSDYEQNEFLNVFAQIKFTITLLLKITGNIDVSWTSIYSMTTAIPSIEMDPSLYHPAVYALFSVLSSFLVPWAAQNGLTASVEFFAGTNSKNVVAWGLSIFNVLKKIPKATQRKVLLGILDSIKDASINLMDWIKTGVNSTWDQLLIKIGIRSSKSDEELAAAADLALAAGVEKEYVKGITAAKRYINNDTILNDHFKTVTTTISLLDKGVSEKIATRITTEMDILNTNYSDIKLNTVTSSVSSFLNILIDFIKQIIAKLCYNNILDPNMLSTCYGVLETVFTAIYSVQTHRNILEYLVKPNILGSDILIKQKTDLTYYVENHSNIYTSININPVLHKYLYYLKNKELKDVPPDTQLNSIKTIYNEKKRYKKMISDNKTNIDKIEYKINKLDKKIKYINTETEIKLENILDKLKLYDIDIEDLDLDIQVIESLFTGNEQQFNKFDKLFIGRLINEVKVLHEKDSLEDLNLEMSTYLDKNISLININNTYNETLVTKNDEYNQALQRVLRNKTINIIINNENLYNFGETVKEQIQNYIKLIGIKDSDETEQSINNIITRINTELNGDAGSVDVVGKICQVDETLKAIQDKISECMNIHDILSKHMSSFFLYIKQQYQLYKKNENIIEKRNQIGGPVASYIENSLKIKKTITNKCAYLKYILFTFAVNYRKILKYKIQYSTIITDDEYNNKWTIMDLNLGGVNLHIMFKKDSTIYNGAFKKLYEDMISRVDTYKNYIRSSYLNEFTKINGYSKELFKIVFYTHTPDSVMVAGGLSRKDKEEIAKRQNESERRKAEADRKLAESREASKRSSVQKRAQEEAAQLAKIEKERAQKEAARLAKIEKERKATEARRLDLQKQSDDMESMFDEQIATRNAAQQAAAKAAEAARIAKLEEEYKKAEAVREVARKAERERRKQEQAESKAMEEVLTQELEQRLVAKNAKQKDELRSESAAIASSFGVPDIATTTVTDKHGVTRTGVEAIRVVGDAIRNFNNLVEIDKMNPEQIFTTIETTYTNFQFDLWQDLIGSINKDIKNNVYVAMYDLLNI